ncbi:MAG: UDP-N-acetylmuramate:L-alanyl-gamma-D-glutamyl-meso-diaminopimelate ligase [Verrucomicrobiota bacterium]
MPDRASNSPKHFHFSGICGTAMGSVAAAMKQQGFVVTGSDAGVYPPMSTFLEEQGIEIREGFAEENIPAEADVVVIGNALSRGNPEVEAVLERKLLYQSLPEVLKNHFLRGRRNLVVTGTHGKTTTVSMLAWILESAGRNPSFMIGGIPRNLGKGARFTESEFTVIEGDEYDTAFFDKRSKFHHYLPEAVVVNNVEFDHADIYDSLDAIKLTFRRMLNLVPRNGCAFVNGDEENALEVAADCPAPVKTVGLGESCDLRITGISATSDHTDFLLNAEEYSVPMHGEFNIRNAAMAVCMARFAGLSADEVREGLADFAGIARRQELRGEAGGVRVIDDFAHHPTAIAQAIDAIRLRYPTDGKLWAVFEPRSNTTQRKVFQDELPAALAKADGVFLAPVANPEKVPEKDRLSTDAVLDAIRSKGKTAEFARGGVAEIVDMLVQQVAEGDVVSVFSNGGFDNVHQRLLDALEQR